MYTNRFIHFSSYIHCSTSTACNGTYFESVMAHVAILLLLEFPASGAYNVSWRHFDCHNACMHAHYKVHMCNRLLKHMQSCDQFNRFIDPYI